MISNRRLTPCVPESKDCSGFGVNAKRTGGWLDLINVVLEINFVS